MIRTMLSMLVRDGEEERFQQIWTSAARQISTFPGQRGQSMVRDLDQPRLFTITADWNSRETLGAFQGSPVRVGLSEALDPLRESATKSVVEVLEIVPASQELVAR